MGSLHSLSPHTKNNAYLPGLATDPEQNGTMTVQLPRLMEHFAAQWSDV